MPLLIVESNHTIAPQISIWNSPTGYFLDQSVRNRRSINVVDHQELNLRLLGIETKSHLIFQGRENGWGIRGRLCLVGLSGFGLLFLRCPFQPNAVGTQKTCPVLHGMAEAM